MPKELTWVDKFVNSMSSSDKSVIKLIEAKYFFLTVLPMWLCMNPM